MKMKTTLLKTLTGLLLLTLHTNGDDSVDAFVIAVDADWATTNYTAILNTIDSRLATNSTDVVALGAKMAFYQWATVDFEEFQEAATNFYVAVSNQFPTEVSNPGAIITFTQAAMALDINPATYPVDQSRTTNQVTEVHSSYPKFPTLDLFVDLYERATEE